MGYVVGGGGGAVIVKRSGVMTAFDAAMSRCLDDGRDYRHGNRHGKISEARQSPDVSNAAPSTI